MTSPVSSSGSTPHHNTPSDPNQTHNLQFDFLQNINEFQAVNQAQTFFAADSSSTPNSYGGVAAAEGHQRQASSVGDSLQGSQNVLANNNPRLVPSLALNNLPISNDVAQTLSRTNSRTGSWNAYSSRTTELQTKDAFIKAQEERLIENERMIRVLTANNERLTQEVKSKDEIIALQAQQIESQNAVHRQVMGLYFSVAGNSTSTKK